MFSKEVAAVLAATASITAATQRISLSMLSTSIAGKFENDQVFPRKCSFPCEDLDSHLARGSVSLPESTHTERRLDRFIRFGRAHSCVQQTER